MVLLKRQEVALIIVLENDIPWQVALLNQDGSWRGCSVILLSFDPVIVSAITTYSNRMILDNLDFDML